MEYGSDETQKARAVPVVHTTVEILQNPRSPISGREKVQALHSVSQQSYLKLKREFECSRNPAGIPPGADQPTVTNMKFLQTLANENIVTALDLKRVTPFLYTVMNEPNVVKLFNAHGQERASRLLLQLFSIVSGYFGPNCNPCDVNNFMFRYLDSLIRNEFDARITPALYFHLRDIKKVSYLGVLLESDVLGDKRSCFDGNSVCTEFNEKPSEFKLRVNFTNKIAQKLKELRDSQQDADTSDDFVLCNRSGGRLVRLRKGETGTEDSFVLHKDASLLKEDGVSMDAPGSTVESSGDPPVASPVESLVKPSGEPPVDSPDKQPAITTSKKFYTIDPVTLSGPKLSKKSKTENYVAESLKKVLKTHRMIHELLSFMPYTDMRSVTDHFARLLYILTHFRKMVQNFAVHIIHKPGFIYQVGDKRPAIFDDKNNDLIQAINTALEKMSERFQKNVSSNASNCTEVIDDFKWGHENYKDCPIHCGQFLIYLCEIGLFNLEDLRNHTFFDPSQMRALEPVNPRVTLTAAQKKKIHDLFLAK